MRRSSSRWSQWSRRHTGPTDGLIFFGVKLLDRTWASYRSTPINVQVIETVRAQEQDGATAGTGLDGHGDRPCRRCCGGADGGALLAALFPAFRLAFQETLFLGRPFVVRPPPAVFSFHRSDGTRERPRSATVAATLASIVGVGRLILRNERQKDVGPVQTTTSANSRNSFLSIVPAVVSLLALRQRRFYRQSFPWLKRNLRRHFLFSFHPLPQFLSIAVDRTFVNVPTALNGLLLLFSHSPHISLSKDSFIVWDHLQ